jgi:NAD(P)-dependent dehydrogenase (short-subunit alcohol dehydrogenase family)
LGDGRATVLRFAREGANVLAVDNNLASAEETVAMARQSGGECLAFEADVANETTLAAMVEAARRRWGRIDVLHYNVGVSIAGGDAPLDEITEDAFDRLATINLRGAIMTCKHVLPLMRAQRAGVIITISSVAAWEQYPNVAYKATKAGMIAFTQQVAIQNAEFGVRANVILPGLIDTPMAVDTRARVTGKSRAEVAAAMPASRCATRWAPLGTSQTPRCFWRPMRRISLPALRCRSMAVRSSTSIEPQLRGVATTPIGQRRPNEEEAKWTRLSRA